MSARASKRLREQACQISMAGVSRSPLPDSNRRPPPYHGGALPTELRGQPGHRSRWRSRVPCFGDPLGGYERDVLRKLLWTGLYAGLGAAATIAARTIASRIWRVATGEQPPVKK
jgi:hypothetical protein